MFLSGHIHGTASTSISFQAFILNVCARHGIVMFTPEYAGKMALWVKEIFSLLEERWNHVNGLSVCEPWFLDSILHVVFFFIPSKPKFVV